MTRSILLLAVGLLAAALFACVQVQAPPPPPQTQLAACPFSASSVRVLAPGYDPSSGTYSPPGQNLQAGATLSPQMVNDINQAFSNAPQAVQNDICALSGIFIDTSSCQGGTINPCTPVNNSVPKSWGIRSSNNVDLGSMYVGIPASLWQTANTNAILFSQYEKTVIQYYALNARNSNWVNGTYPLPTVSRVNPDTSWPTVLAALAHELGHVKFNYTIHKPNKYNGNYYFDYLEKCNNNTLNFFNWWSYSRNYRKLIPKNYWRKFGSQDDLNGDALVDHSIYPFLSDFKDLAHYPDPNVLLYALYSGEGEPWASFWGAWSPDEDFVETYVLSALLANVTTLQISIGGNSYDIIVNTTKNNKPFLYSKIQCVQHLPTIGQ